MRILVIADLVHASPRIPELIAGLCDLYEHEVVVLCPAHSPQQLDKINLPETFSSAVELVKTPVHQDCFQWIRGLLGYFRYKSENSYSEQLKSSFGNRSYFSNLIDWTLRVYQAFVAIPDTERSWINLAKKTYRAELSGRDFDCILSSSPYPSVHFVARWIKKQAPVFWVADFRDPWTLSHNYQLPKWRALLDTYMEKQVIADSDLVITVSAGFAQKLQNLHSRPVQVVRNGYRERSLRTKYKRHDKLVISYTGSIYSGKQNPLVFLRAIYNLMRCQKISRADIEVNFYGRLDSELQRFIDDHQLAGIVTQRGYVSRSKSIQIQESSDVLLMCNWEAANESGIFPLKFYEYLGSRRPILATGRDYAGEITEILSQTSAGLVISETSEMEAFILDKLLEIKRDGRVNYYGNETAISAYSYRSSSRCLQQILSQSVVGLESR